jgi:replicative DNA helicase
MALHPELPQNDEAECATLGAVILNGEQLTVVAAWLKPEMFYLERRAQIYQAMLSVAHRGDKVSIKTVSFELKRLGLLESVGGIEYLSDLIVGAYSQHIEEYAREVERMSIYRRLITAGGKIAALGYNATNSGEEAIADAQAHLSTITARGGKRGLVSFASISERYMADMESGITTGIVTDYRDLDDMTGGLHKQDLIIVAARPSVGKTAFSLSLAYNLGKRGECDTLFFSLEMSSDQVYQRAAAMQARIDLMSIRLGRLNLDQQRSLMEAIGELHSMPIHVDDAAAQTVAYIRSEAHRHIAEHGRPVVVVIDYLQLMTSGKKENRVQEVSDISRTLKILAREIDAPVIALSQLSRAVEGRQTHVPMLSDLRDSGSIEQDADIVIMLYREELYDKETEKRGIAELHIMKHRNGPIGVIPMHFDASTTRFDTLTYRSPEGY